MVYTKCNVYLFLLMFGFVSRQLVDKSLSKVSGSMVKKGKMSEDEAAEMVATTRGRMSGSTDKGAVADCDLVLCVIPLSFEMFIQHLVLPDH